MKTSRAKWPSTAASARVSSTRLRAMFSGRSCTGTEVAMSDSSVTEVEVRDSMQILLAVWGRAGGWRRARPGRLAIESVRGGRRARLGLQRAGLSTQAVHEHAQLQVHARRADQLGRGRATGA